MCPGNFCREQSGLHRDYKRYTGQKYVFNLTRALHLFSYVYTYNCKMHYCLVKKDTMSWNHE